MFNEDTVLAVKHGAYWLDENHPGWAQRINLQELEMSECSYCIIGQAVGDYLETITEASGTKLYGKNAVEWSIQNGFDIDFDDDSNVYHKYAELETLWAEQVEQRLGRKI